MRLLSELKKTGKQFFLLLGLFFILITVTTAYSLNFMFGLLKLINIVAFGFPFIIITRLFLLNASDEDKKLFIIFISVVVLTGSVIVLLFNPFIQNELYEFKLTRWSHVVFARTTAPLILILFFHLFKQKQYQKSITFGVITGLGYYSIYISNLRAAFLGMSGIILVTILIKIFKKQLKNIQFSGLIAAFVVFSISLLISPGNNIIKERYVNLYSSEIGKIDKDPSINSRLTGYAISWELIKKYPFLGVGFGGFKNYSNADIKLSNEYGNIDIKGFTDWLKYPHNIFIEFQVEMGIAGTIFFLVILFLIIRTTYKYSTELLLFYVFALWLALFSKDISTNILFFTGLAFYGNPYETERMKELLFPKRNAGVR